MTQTSSEPRPHHAPYAALRTAADDEAGQAQRDKAHRDQSVSPGASSSSPATDVDYLAAEADRLESFKQALFAAFLAAPKTGIPTALVDLAATYTSALRLQMTLRGLVSVPQRAFKAQMFGAGKCK